MGEPDDGMSERVFVDIRSDVVCAKMDRAVCEVEKRGVTIVSNSKVCWEEKIRGCEAEGFVPGSSPPAGMLPVAIGERQRDIKICDPSRAYI